MVDIQYAIAEIRRGKKKKEDGEIKVFERNHRAINIVACPVPQGGHN